MTCEQMLTALHTALRAGEIASAPVITVESDVDALAALRTMQRNQIRHLPVFANGRCVGRTGSWWVC
jgi:CBS domain-containing protein